jgi:competence protein ComEA
MLLKSIRGLATPALMSMILLGVGTVTTGQTTAQPRAKAKATEPAAASAPLDLNKATAEELAARLPGVGEVTAKKIVVGRPYTKVDDLARAGVPARTIEGIRKLVTVGPKQAEAPKSARPGSPKAVAGPRVNINKATREELDGLPGIGPVLARAIIDARPFKTIEDIKKIKGIKEVEFAKIKDLISVNGP